MPINFFKFFIFYFLFLYSFVLYSHEKKYLLGVSVGNVTKSVINKLELKDKSGAIILELSELSAAKQGGLLVGDVIVKIDNQKINNFNELINYISTYEGDGIIDIMIFRNKKILNIPIKLTEE